jgi:hypothetical protein
MENGKVIAEGLPRGCRGYHNEMAPLSGETPRLCLMAIEALHAAGRNRPSQAGLKLVRQRAVAALSGRDHQFARNPPAVLGCQALSKAGNRVGIVYKAWGRLTHRFSIGSWMI